VMRRRKTTKVLPPPRGREQLEAKFGRAWDTSQLAAEFVVTSINGAEVVVRRKADNQVGTLRYQNEPRLYFGFVAAPPTGGDQ
jgi:hypothetical protein